MHTFLFPEIQCTSPQGQVVWDPGAANLLDEKVAGLLEQHHEPPWGVVGLARGPNETDHVEERLKLWLHLGKLHALEGFQVVVEWPQVHVDVLRLCQSWKE